MKEEIEIEMDYARKMLETTTDERIKAYFDGYLDALKVLYTRFN